MMISENHSLENNTRNQSVEPYASYRLMVYSLFGLPLCMSGGVPKWFIYFVLHDAHQFKMKSLRACLKKYPSDDPLCPLSYVILPKKNMYHIASIN